MATVSVTCSECGNVTEADEALAGSIFNCTECSNAVMVPLAGIVEGMDIGGFVLKRQLGVGSMGEVWLAQQQTMDRLVALKLLSPDLTHNPQFVSRFLKEVKI